MEKNTGKVREFCQSRKVGTLLQVLAHLNPQKVSKETNNIHIGSPS